MRFLRASRPTLQVCSSDDLIQVRFKIENPVIENFLNDYALQIKALVSCVNNYDIRTWFSDEICRAEKPTAKFMELLNESLFRELEALFILDILQTNVKQALFDPGGKAPLHQKTQLALQFSGIVPIFLYAEHTTILSFLERHCAWQQRSNYAAAELTLGWKHLCAQHRRERLGSYIEASTMIVAIEDASGKVKSPTELSREILYRLAEYKLAATARKNSYIGR